MMLKNGILFAAGSALEFFGQSEIMSKLQNPWLYIVIKIQFYVGKLAIFKRYRL